MRCLSALRAAAAIAALAATAAWDGAADAAPLGGTDGIRATVSVTGADTGAIDFRLPAGERLILDRGTSVRFDLMFNLPESAVAARGEPVLRPSGQLSSDPDGPSSRELTPAGIEVNSRASGFLPWLDTFYLASGDALGFSGSRGPHSRWSNEIDQWIAELDGLGIR